MRRATPTQQPRLQRKPAPSVALRGPVESFNHDGTLVARHRVPRRAVPWHGLALILATLLLFKAAMHVSLGAASYEARVNELASGNSIQKVGAWLLTAEPATVWLSSTMQSIVR